MSDSNRTQLALIRESQRGVMPATPAFSVIRTTGTPSLGQTPNTVTSNEIRADRQISDLILVGIEVGGSIEAELSYSSHDLLIEGALQSTFSVNPTITNSAADTEITDVVDTTDTFEVASNGTDFVVNALVKTENFTNDANNLIFAVTASTATTVVGPTLALVDETAPPQGAQLRMIGFEGPAGDIDAVANGLSSGVIDFTTFGLLPGDWVKIGGTGAVNRFLDANLNEWARIESVATNLIIFDQLPPSWTTETGTALNIRVFVGERIRNGTTTHSYAVEQQFQDHSPVTYSTTLGQTVDTLTLTAESQSIVTTSYALIGQTGTIDDAGGEAGATYINPTTTSVLNSSSNVGNIREGGAQITGPNFVLSASMELANNLRAQNAVGYISNIGIGSGSFNVTGSLNTYFGNKTLIKKVIDNERTSLDLRFNDADNHSLIFDMPRLKFSSGAPDVAGGNADVTAELGYQAFRHETLGYTLQIQRFHYYE